MCTAQGLGSTGEVAGEGLLLVCLDRTFAVFGTDPADGFTGRMAAEDRETGERSTGATVAAVAADLDALALPGPVAQGLERHDHPSWIVWDAEVGPIEVFVGPRWLPPLVEVEPEVRGYLAGIGSGTAEGHGS